jgi:DNA-binding CsgD family transcriptional regulator
MRMLADVASLKADPVAQRRELLNGMSRLLGVSTAGFFIADGFRPGEQLAMKAMMVGDGSDSRWLRYCADFASAFPITEDPYTDHMLHSEDPFQLWRMGQVIPDHPDSYHRYGPAMQVVRDLQLVDGMIAGFRTGPKRSTMAGISFHRLAGQDRFTGRQERMLVLAATELCGLVERGHFKLRAADEPNDEPNCEMFAGLSPQPRRVLKLLLAGHSPKEIAQTMGLSVWTIRDYVKHIYAHFGVNGRDELMARFVFHDLRGGT